MFELPPDLPLPPLAAVLEVAAGALPCLLHLHPDRRPLAMPVAQAGVNLILQPALVVGDLLNGEGFLFRWGSVF